MDPRAFRTRRGFVHLAIQVALIALCVRLAVIQCLHHPRYAALADGMQHSLVIVPAHRGHIVDRNYRGLAVTLDLPSVYINPLAVPRADRARVAGVLAQTVSADEALVMARLSKPLHFAWVKRKVTAAEADAVAALGVPGIGFREESARRYPNGAFLCHALGFVGMDENGLGGLEARFDAVLAGTPGRQVVMRDGMGRSIEIDGLPFEPVRHGRWLVLSIDARIQRVVEEELAALAEAHKPESASAVVMDPWTGDILALAGVPVFLPERFGEVPAAQRKPVAVTDCLEPGSSFKPFVAAIALARGKVTADTKFDCHRGSYRIGGRTVHDAHPFGVLSVRDIIAYSSNIGMAQVCARLQPDELYRGLRAFGFGASSNVALPGESRGILRPPSEWSNMSMASLAMGQEIAVSPLQLTAAFCVFANGGWYCEPRLVLGTTDAQGRNFRPLDEKRVIRRVLDERTAHLLCRDLLAGVVERGTARRVAIEGCRLAGKTGTAQIAFEDGGGYEPGAYTATFVGIVPADAPRFVIGIVAKRPSGSSYYGGVVAAPAVSRIAERILSVFRLPRNPGPANRRLARAG